MASPSKQGTPLTRRARHRSAERTTHEAPSRLLPAKRPVCARGPTTRKPEVGVGWTPSTATPTVLWRLGHSWKTSATPLSASPHSRLKGLLPPALNPTPSSDTCRRTSHQSTAMSEHPLGFYPAAAAAAAQVRVVFIALLNDCISFQAFAACS